MSSPEIQTSKGSPIPLGCTLYQTRPGINGATANFALFAAHATSVTLGLFKPTSPVPFYTVPMHRTGDHWHICLSPFPKDAIYGYQCDKKEPWLLDPYAKIITAEPTWVHPTHTPLLAASLPSAPFDWEGTSHPNISKRDLIIYEMHIRGFTRHPSSKTAHPGTFLGVIEKIPYLKKLGVTAIECMPLYEFDENSSPAINPTTQKPLPNYWGYDPLTYFSPKSSYSSISTLGGALTEFKTMVKELHKNGLEIILDVVYNHTGKSSLEQIDRETYYMTDADGASRDYTGCGNTINANNPPVQELILESLRYWVTECHVDGFRFDLASTLTRNPDGHPLNPSPLLLALAQDPILSQRKLIAEAWDAAGLYQVGSFPNWGPWSEWNGKYRDIVRRFIKGTNGKAGLFANAFCGSDFLYHNASPLASVNFITSHDGFCLRDLVTYQNKHNWPNGEMNRDGCNHNDSWNCGIEGLTKDKTIQELRERQMRNFWLALLLAQGIPMILMGDEYGHTRHGNNNPYVQDNELNWFLWYELEEKPHMFHFVQTLIAFRKSHPELREPHFLELHALDWHGALPYQPDWSGTSRFIAFSTKQGQRLYIAFNANYLPIDVQLPSDATWRVFVDTNLGWEQLERKEKGPVITGPYHMAAHTALIAVTSE